MAEKTSEQTPIIFLDNISVTFKSRTGSLFHPNLVHAVNGLTLKLMPGETIGIVGESGCGKSTTANVMCGLQSPTDGHVYFKGDDVTKRTAELRMKIGRVVSVVFQNPATALNPRMSVHDQLLDPLVVHKVGTEDEREARVRELLGGPHGEVPRPRRRRPAVHDLRCADAPLGFLPRLRRLRHHLRL